MLIDMTWIRNEELKLTWLERLAVNIIKQGKIPEHVAIIMGEMKIFRNLPTFLITSHNLQMEIDASL